MKRGIQKLPKTKSNDFHLIYVIIETRFLIINSK